MVKKKQEKKNKRKSLINKNNKKIKENKRKKNFQKSKKISQEKEEQKKANEKELKEKKKMRVMSFYFLSFIFSLLVIGFLGGFAWYKNVCLPTIIEQKKNVYRETVLFSLQNIDDRLDYFLFDVENKFSVKPINEKENFSPDFRNSFWIQDFIQELNIVESGISIIPKEMIEADRDVKKYYKNVKKTLRDYEKISIFLQETDPIFKEFQKIVNKGENDASINKLNTLNGFNNLEQVFHLKAQQLQELENKMTLVVVKSSETQELKTIFKDLIKMYRVFYQENALIMSEAKDGFIKKTQITITNASKEAFFIKERFNLSFLEIQDRIDEYNKGVRQLYGGQIEELKMERERLEKRLK